MTLQVLSGGYLAAAGMCGGPLDAWSSWALLLCCCCCCLERKHLRLDVKRDLESIVITSRGANRGMPTAVQRPVTSADCQSFQNGGSEGL